MKRKTTTNFYPPSFSISEMLEKSRGTLAIRAVADYAKATNQTEEAIVHAAWSKYPARRLDVALHLYFAYDSPNEAASEAISILTGQSDNVATRTPL